MKKTLFIFLFLLAACGATGPGIETGPVYDIDSINLYMSFDWAADKVRQLYPRLVMSSGTGEIVNLFDSFITISVYGLDGGLAYVNKTIKSSFYYSSLVDFYKIQFGGPVLTNTNFSQWIYKEQNLKISFTSNRTILELWAPERKSKL